MRATIILLFLCSTFFYGGKHTAYKPTDSYRSTNVLSPNLTCDQQDFVDSSNLYDKIIEDNDLYLLEESHSTDDVPHTFFTIKGSLIKKSFESLSSIFILKDNFKGIKNFQPFYGYSQPIYILLRVLRI